MLSNWRTFQLSMFTEALVPDASAEKVTVVALCLCCHYLCYTLLPTPVLSLAELVNCFWSSVCPSNEKISREKKLYTCPNVAMERGGCAAGRCLSASLPNQLKELNYLIAQPEIWTIYSKSSCRWRHIYTNCAITCFIPISTAILLGHSPDLDRDDCREISALLTNTRSSRASIMPQQQAAPMVIQLPAITSVVSVIKN